MSEQGFHINIDEKAIAKQAPLMLRGEVEKNLAKLEQFLDTMDLNHDGKRDVAQLAKIVFILMPVADKINDVVDFNLFAEWVAKQEFVKDKALAVEILKKVCHEIESH